MRMYTHARAEYGGAFLPSLIHSFVHLSVYAAQLPESGRGGKYQLPLLRGGVITHFSLPPPPLLRSFDLFLLLHLSLPLRLPRALTRAAAARIAGALSFCTPTGPLISPRSSSPALALPRSAGALASAPPTGKNGALGEAGAGPAAHAVPDCF